MPLYRYSGIFLNITSRYTNSNTVISGNMPSLPG